MANPTRLEVNCETGEVLEIELTDVEIAEREAQAQAFAVQQATLAAEQAAKDAAKTAAINKLAKLGLTEAEVQALLS